MKSFFDRLDVFLEKNEISMLLAVAAIVGITLLMRKFLAKKLQEPMPEGGGDENGVDPYYFRHINDGTVEAAGICFAGALICILIAAIRSAFR